MNKNTPITPFAFLSSRGRILGARARSFGPGGRSKVFHAGFFGRARAVRPAWAQTENPGCTYTAQTRGYADLNFELPFSKGGFAIFRPFALHRCEEERFQAILGATPPNNQQFVGCQPTAEVWWLELHYYNRRLQSVTSSASIPASVRSRFGVIFFLFPPIPSLCFAVAFTTRLGAWPHPEYQPGGVRACFRHLVWGRRGAGRSAFGPLSCCSAPPSVPAGVATHAHPSVHTNTPLASLHSPVQ